MPSFLQNRKYAKHVLALWDTIHREGFLSMLNELRRSEMFSLKISHEELLHLPTPFIILFSHLSGFVGLKVAFLTDHWNQQGPKGKEGIHYTSYTHHAMLNQHSFPCFICHYSIRGLRRLCISLFKARKTIKSKPSLNLLRPFHLYREKGEFICYQTGDFSSPSGTSFLKYGRKRWV